MLELEWQNMLHSQRNRVYRERERFEMARSIAAILRENGGNYDDDVSAITTPTSNTAQASQNGNRNIH
jgi:hypothetical protein